MDDLAAELGMSKKTLYAHFRSKAALVEAAVLDKLGGLEAELEHIEAECPSDFPETVETRRAALIQRHFGRLFAERRKWKNKR